MGGHAEAANLSLQPYPPYLIDLLPEGGFGCSLLRESGGIQHRGRTRRPGSTTLALVDAEGTGDGWTR